MINSLKSRAGMIAAGFGALTVAFVGMVAEAGATATYDITPVTSGVTTELTANLPVILGAIGALLALGLAVKAVRKFVKV
jgi:hypothetical protein